MTLLCWVAVPLLAEPMKWNCICLLGTMAIYIFNFWSISNFLASKHLTVFISQWLCITCFNETFVYTVITFFHQQFTMHSRAARIHREWIILFQLTTLGCRVILLGLHVVVLLAAFCLQLLDCAGEDNISLPAPLYNIVCFYHNKYVISKLFLCNFMSVISHIFLWIFVFTSASLQCQQPMPGSHVQPWRRLMPALPYPCGLAQCFLYI